MADNTYERAVLGIRERPRTSRTRILAGLLAAVVFVSVLASGITIDLKREPSYTRRSLGVIGIKAFLQQRSTRWTPAAGATWQIQLSTTPPAKSLNVSTYDIDLFDNSAATIASLKSQGRKVICYFSAGSSEDWRPDFGSFLPADKGSALAGWAGENWLNTNSANVRTVMAKRMDLAVSKGCDAVDPDNMDAYDNGGGGFKLKSTDAVSYITYLSATAHAKGLSIGLKNAGVIIPQVVSLVEFAINEQCVEYNECTNWKPFIKAGKPVFNIEYPPGAPNVAASKKAKICGTASRQGFSTILKNMNLDDWMTPC